jgi:hypothetical protein
MLNHKNYNQMNEDEFEDFVLGLDDNIEEVTTCLAETKDGQKEHGLVITVGGKDIVLLQSDLQDIIDYLDELPFVES